MNIKNISAYFNLNHKKEEKRLCQNEYSRFTFDLHLKYLQPYLGLGGQTVLDAGCGAGGYALEIMKWGNDLHLVDLSDELMKTAVTLINENRLQTHLLSCNICDVCHLTHLQNESIDTVICMGGVLNFLLMNIGQALDEFYRILKNDGVLIISVGSKYGALKNMLSSPPSAASFIIKQFVKNDFLTNGIIEPFYSNIPARKLYSVEQFRLLLEEHFFRSTEIRAIPSVASFLYPLLQHVYGKDSYRALLQLEQEVSTIAGLLDSGDFYLYCAKKERVR